MESMVEKVARAICETDFEDPDADYGGLPRWRAFEANAQAAILAMREPTEAMLEAAEARDGFTHEDQNASASAHWEAMIDAALRDD